MVGPSSAPKIQIDLGCITCSKTKQLIAVSLNEPNDIDVISKVAQLPRQLGDTNPMDVTSTDGNGHTRKAAWTMLNEDHNPSDSLSSLAIQEMESWKLDPYQILIHLLLSKPARTRANRDPTPNNSKSISEEVDGIQYCCDPNVHKHISLRETVGTCPTPLVDIAAFNFTIEMVKELPFIIQT